MIPKQTSHSIDERIEMHSDEQQHNGPESPEPQPRRRGRPEMRQLFDARWERNEPAYRLLAEH